MYIHKYINMCIHIYIYIYISPRLDKLGEIFPGSGKLCVVAEISTEDAKLEKRSLRENIHLRVYIYIYIYRCRWIRVCIYI